MTERLLSYKHYSKKIYEVPCGGCLDLVMLSPYNPDKEPEFVFYQKNRPTVKSLLQKVHKALFPEHPERCCGRKMIHSERFTDAWLASPTCEGL